MPKKLIDAVLIGVQIGLKNGLGKSSQAFASLIGNYIGKELIKYAEDYGRMLNSLEAVKNYLVDINFAEEVIFNDSKGEFSVRLKNCEICPKRIGGYEFEGSACVFPGILSALVSHAVNKQFSLIPKLEPADECKVTLSF